jgi:hypothetical protein
MDRLPAYTGESRACPTAWGAVSTWTRCGERLAPRRASEGYTAEPSTHARLVCQAYHRHPGRTAPHLTSIDFLGKKGEKSGASRRSLLR